MRRALFAIAVVAAASTSYVPAARAAEGPVGFLCGSSGTMYPPARLRLVGEMHAGPLAVGDRTGRITCTIQSGASTHDGPDLAVVTGPTTYGVLALAEPFDYVPVQGQFAYLCTQVDFTDGTTLYWDDRWYGDGSWSTDPASQCYAFITSDIPYDPCDVYVCYVCLVLQPVLPPDGDVPGAWDCRPYHA